MNKLLQTTHSSFFFFFLFIKRQLCELHTKSCGGSKKTQNVKEMHKKWIQEIQSVCQDQMSTFNQSF